MGQTTFNFDAHTEEVIEGLKMHFHATTKAEVIRKALALLEFAKKTYETGGEVNMTDKDGNVKTILIG